MNTRFYGRKVGSDQAMILLFDGDEPTTDGYPVDPGVLNDFTVANARRAANTLRERGIEGYVLFGDDPTQYAFTPDADFVYPSGTAVPAAAPLRLADLPDFTNIEIDGHTWSPMHWKERTDLRLVSGDQRHRVEVTESRRADAPTPIYQASVSLSKIRAVMARRKDFTTVHDAIAWAIGFEFSTRRAGSLTWFASEPDANYWYAAIGASAAEIFVRAHGANSGPSYLITRTLQLGDQTVEFKVSDMTIGEEKRAIVSFEQASAIALTMTDYVLELMRETPADDTEAR